jgi:hypothetical protein
MTRLSYTLARCHACQRTTMSGTVTCENCRGKGHTDLNCLQCRKEQMKATNGEATKNG